MKCPTCNILLATSEMAGVEIDYCPKCWGVWLDRGELKLILKRSSSDLAMPESNVAEPTADQDPPQRRPAVEPQQHAPGSPLSWASVVSQTR